MIINIIAALVLAVFIVVGVKLMRKVPIPTDFDRYVSEFGVLWDRRVLDSRMEGPYIVTDEKGQFVIYTGLGISNTGDFVKVER